MFQSIRLTNPNRNLRFDALNGVQPRLEIIEVYNVYKSCVKYLPNGVNEQCCNIVDLNLQGRKDIQAEVVVANIPTVIKDLV